MSAIVNRLLGRKCEPVNHLDEARDAIDGAREARRRMDHSSRIRRREVAEVRLEQIEIRRNINLLEDALLGKSLNGNNGGDA